MPYPTISGIVVKGQGLGRQIGFPTANIEIKGGKPPEKGVYRVRIGGAGLADRLAVCNVGLRPTVSDDSHIQVEVHIPGFSGDLYGAILRVSFLCKIRDEKKFPSVKALKQQISQDVKSLEST